MDQFIRPEREGAIEWEHLGPAWVMWTNLGWESGRKKAESLKSCAPEFKSGEPGKEPNLSEILVSSSAKWGL